MKKLLIILLLLMGISVKSEPVDKRNITQTEISFKNQSTISKSSNTKLTEGQAYKMLYENQIKSNDSILKTIYYALGGLATAILAVFASNWWFNEKKVKDIVKGIDLQIVDAKNAILSEVTEKLNTFYLEKTIEINQSQTKLQKEVTSNISILTSKVNELSEKLRIEIKEDNKISLENYQKQLDSFNSNYRQQITTLNENAAMQISTLKDLITSSEEINKRENNELWKEIERIAFYMWEHRGVMINAIRAKMREIKRVLNQPNWEGKDYSLYLEQLLESLEQLTYIYAPEKKDIISTIKKIPKKHDEIKNKILAIIEKLEVEERD